MQAGADARPNTFPDRLTLAPSLDHPEWHTPEPEPQTESQPESCSDPHANAEGVTLELADGEEACREKIRS
jgi:hypothetical protein